MYMVKNVQVTLIFSCVEGMESYLSLNMFVIVLIYVVGDYVFLSIVMPQMLYTK